MLDSQLASKGYRYEVLLKAIDFFTQRFNLEQISHYAFEFSNEILTLHSAALFVRKESEYVLTNSRLYDEERYQIPCTAQLEEIPVLHGDIISSHFEQFFDSDFLETFNVELVIPLIINDYLYGFIISDRKMLSSFDEDDWIIASTLTKLFGNSLANSKQMDELHLKNKQLDQKVFNLFAINQSAKSLLAEVDLAKLYTLATDVFSEITCSRVTSFGIYDSNSNSIKVLGYRNVSNFASVSTELQLFDQNYQNRRLVLDFEKDLETIQSLFVNWKDFYTLETKYIILLVKDRVLGVVTLSEAVNERSYDEATFELVETLASFTHIAISNALLFKKLVEKNKRVQRKYHILSTLNKITQNITSGESIEELSALTLKVLALNFNVKKAFFAYTGQEGYVVANRIGLQMHPISFALNDNWDQALQGEMVLDYSKKALRRFFSREVAAQFGSSNCIVISPLCCSSNFQYDNSFPKGFLVVLETGDSLKEEEILLIDTIAKNISPVIYQMDLSRKIKENYKMDSKREFIQAVETKLTERKDYSLEFYLYYKIAEKNPFEPTCDLIIEDEECYVVNQFVFMLTYNPFQDKAFCQIPRFESIEEIINFDYIGTYESYKNK